MKRIWPLALWLVVGCADVIGADFDGKTLVVSSDGAGGAASGGAGSGGASSMAGSGAVPKGTLVINEICVTPELTFIELYNGDDKAATLDEYRLVDGSGSPLSTVPMGLSGSLAPGAYLSVEDCGRPECALSFDHGGDTVELVARMGGNLLDSVHYPGVGGSSILKDGESYARVPDGTESFAAGTPTPGKANEPSPP